MGQSTPSGLGITLLEGPQLGEKQCLVLVALHCVERVNLLAAHGVLHQAVAQRYNVLNIDPHRALPQGARHKRVAVREVEVQLGVLFERRFPMLTHFITHVALAQAIVVQHVVEQQSRASAQRLALEVAVTHRLVAPGGRQSCKHSLYHLAGV